MWGRVHRLTSRVNGSSWAAWVISGVGLALAGLSLWYLIVIKAMYLGSAFDEPLVGLSLKVIEITLLAGFSLVLIYGGYWLAASPFGGERLWWAGLWTMLGLAGVVAIVGLVTAFQISQGQTISEPSLIQEMLLAAGGGALAGLLIGISTVRETVEAERAREQRNTLKFVNELLRHNVLNGMQLIQGYTTILEDHVDEEGRTYLATTEKRTESIVELIENVRALMRAVSGEEERKPVSLTEVVTGEVTKARDAYPAATFSVDLPDGVSVEAGELLDAVFENLFANAVDHNDTETPTVEVRAAVQSPTVRVEVADNGPGIPDDRKEAYFEPGEQGDSVGQGLGLYLVETLVDRYDGDVWIEDNDPRGTVVVLELPRAE